MHNNNVLDQSYSFDLLNVFGKYCIKIKVIIKTIVIGQVWECTVENSLKHIFALKIIFERSKCDKFMKLEQTNQTGCTGSSASLL